MDILNTILANTYTTSDLRHRIRILKSHLEDTLFNKEGSEPLSPDDSLWISSIDASFIKNFTKDNIYSNFIELENQVKNLNPLIIYLSFEPTKEQIENIGRWLQNNLTKTRLFDIKIDPSLLGGIALVKDGVYKDFSLKSKIQEQEETILIEFKKYRR